jgi:hypothetical protein
MFAAEHKKQVLGPLRSGKDDKLFYSPLLADACSQFPTPVPYSQSRVFRFPA